MENAQSDCDNCDSYAQFDSRTLMLLPVHLHCNTRRCSHVPDPMITLALNNPRFH